MSEKEILSQDEVDTLLSGVDEGSVSTESTTDTAEEVVVLDFANQERVIHSQFPVLERIHERLSRKFTDSIYDLVSDEVEVVMNELRISKFQEFLQSMTMPSSINIIRIHPLRGKAMVLFDDKLIFSLVENYFGGDGRYKSSIEEREFTQVEQRISKIALDAFVTDIQNAWSPIMELNFEFLNAEMNPQLVNIASANDVMLIAPFEVKFEENGGMVYMVVPYTMLEPIRERLDLGASRSDDESDPNWVKTLQEDLLDVPLEISSTLTETKINLRDILNVKVGDVIPIDMPETVTLKIEDIPSFRAQFGISNDNCALKIVNTIKR